MVPLDLRENEERLEPVVLMVTLDVPDVLDPLEVPVPPDPLDPNPTKVPVVNPVLLVTQDSLVPLETEEPKDFKENKESPVFPDLLDPTDLKDIKENEVSREKLVLSVVPETQDQLDLLAKMVSPVFVEPVVNKVLLVSPVNLDLLVCPDLKDLPAPLEPPERSVSLVKLDLREPVVTLDPLDAMEIMVLKDSLVFPVRREPVVKMEALVV